MRGILLTPLRAPDAGDAPQAGASPAADQPQAGEASTQTQQPPATPAPAAADDAPLTAAEARELRREAQSLRRRLRELEAAGQEQQRAQLTDAERLRADHEAAQARLGSLESEVRGYRIRDAIDALARPATVGDGEAATANPYHGIDVRLAARLIDPEDLTWDEDGRPTNLRATLSALVREFPQLQQAPAAAGAAPAPAGTPFPRQQPAGSAPAGSAIAALASEHIRALEAARAAAPNPLKQR